MPSIALSPDDHKTLLDHYRRSPEPAVRLRAHILLLLAAGHPWATVSAVLFCSLSTINRWCTSKSLARSRPPVRGRRLTPIEFA
jgi:hypothetical protein